MSKCAGLRMPFFYIAAINPSASYFYRPADNIFFNLIKNLLDKGCEEVSYLFVCVCNIN